jgi:hypothetical protein
MAHFAKLENNIVITVNSVVNEVIKDSNGVEQEAIGIEFLKTLYNEPNAIWKQTSYNNKIRKNYAGIGYTYDESRDAFIPPKPFNSWILNEDNCNWEAPISMPNDVSINKQYIWNESIINWEVKTTI